jgi:hypothetical protein
MSTLGVISDFLGCLLGAIFVRPLVGIGCLLRGRWEVLGCSIIDYYIVDFIWLILLSLLLRVLVRVHNHYVWTISNLKFIFIFD